MPNLLSIPRELRDNIYNRLLNVPLQPWPSSRSRKRVSKQKAKDGTTDYMDNPTIAADSANDNDDDDDSLSIPIDPRATEDDSGSIASTIAGTDYYAGEEAVRYPLAKPIPPMHSLFGANRQLRAEMLDTVSRKQVRYKIRLSFRDDIRIIYPSWVSVPALTDRVDVLDVDIRIRHGKSSSLFSMDGDDDVETEGNLYYSGLLLLQRFLERGAYFLSKKRAQKITVGLLALYIVPKDVDDSDPNGVFDDVAQAADDILLNKINPNTTPQNNQRNDELIHFFAERIDRLSCHVGDSRREWNMKDTVAEGDRLKHEKVQEVEVLDGASAPGI